MRLRARLVLFICMTAVFISGCANRQRSDSVNQTQNTNAKSDQQRGPRIIGQSPPSGSPFSKISLGMPMSQVHDLIGQPTDSASYMTGKAFIPFYFGNDAARLEAFYKGQGRITFAGGAGLTGGQGFKVYYIIYDPDEDGYNNR